MNVEDTKSQPSTSINKDLWNEGREKEGMEKGQITKHQATKKWVHIRKGNEEMCTEQRKKMGKEQYQKKQIPVEKGKEILED